MIREVSGFNSTGLFDMPMGGGRSFEKMRSDVAAGKGITELQARACHPPKT